MKLKRDIRIVHGGQKCDLKKWFEKIVFDTNEYKKFAPHCTTKFYEVDDAKLTKLLKKGLKDLKATEFEKEGSLKEGQAEADERLAKELKRREELNKQEVEEEVEEEVKEEETKDKVETPADPFEDEAIEEEEPAEEVIEEEVKEDKKPKKK